MLVRDHTGSLRAIWFNQPFLNDVFHPHQRVILFGKLELSSHGLQMQSPQYEIVRGDADDETGTAQASAEGAPPQAAASAQRGGDGAPPSEVRKDPEETLHTGRIVPVYEKTGQLTAKVQRTLVHHALQQLPTSLPDPLPVDVRQRQGLFDRRGARH